jgi:hypothetical protein
MCLGTRYGESKLKEGKSEQALWNKNRFGEKLGAAGLAGLGMAQTKIKKKKGSNTGDSQT